MCLKSLLVVTSAINLHMETLKLLQRNRPVYISVSNLRCSLTHTSQKGSVTNTPTRFQLVLLLLHQPVQESYKQHDPLTFTRHCL